jgi:ATP-dependent Clp protease ATP-binding subunit ClpA
LELARQAAAGLHKQNIQLPTMMMALAQYRRSVLKRLLEAQNIAPEQVYEIARDMANALGTTGNNGLSERTVLNQDDFQNVARYVLRLAWEIAQYDTPPTISDVHLFAGLLMQIRIVALLQTAGVDIDLMNVQLLWG